MATTWDKKESTAALCYDPAAADSETAHLTKKSRLSRMMEKKKLKLYAAFVITVVIVGVVVGLAVHFGVSKSNDVVVNVVVKPHSADAAEQYSKAAVAADHKTCSKIGRDILKKKGSAVDALIASLICVGALNLQSTGIGGGGFMVVYNRKYKKAEAFDYRETGPANMTEDMYNYDKTSNLVGGRAVGVPGEIRGLRAAYKKYGQLPWKTLLQPTIDLCNKGFPVGKHLYITMKKLQKYIFADAGLRELLVYPGTNKLREEGSILKRPKLGKTLERISELPDDLYTGELAKQFVKDVQANNNGLLSLDDMKNYKVVHKTPLATKFGTDTLYTLPPPNGGPVLTHILNMIEGYNFNSDDTSTLDKKILTYHRIIESLKFSYAYRPYLGDPAFQSNMTFFNKIYQKVIGKDQAMKDRARITDKMTHNTSYYSDFFTKTEDRGTTHVSVLAENGDAAAATDTINYGFGAKFRSTTSGILFNNELADFFTNRSYSGYPWPRANAPGPGKRPLSSTCPTIIVDDKGDVKMVVGGSGGTRITLSVAWVIMKKLWFDMELGAAVVDARAQHALFPEYIRNEKDYPLPPAVVSGLRKKGHVIKSSTLYAVVQAIFKDKKGVVHAKSDPRKYGKSAGY